MRAILNVDISLLKRQLDELIELGAKPSILDGVENMLSVIISKFEDGFTGVLLERKPDLRTVSKKDRQYYKEVNNMKRERKDNES